MHFVYPLTEIKKKETHKQNQKKNAQKIHKH